MEHHSHIPIFYEGQDDLIEILAISMVSVCYNTKSFIDFYILDCGLNDFNKRQLNKLKEKFNNFSIEFIPVDLKQFHHLRGYGPNLEFFDLYARLLIPNIKPQLDKAIYLDSDVLCLGDIQQLWNIDLGDYPYAAAPELGYDNIIKKHCVENLNINQEHIYTNVGITLLNLKKWRELKATEKILELAKEYKNDIWIIHEDLFSMFFGCNNYKRLEQRFNLADRINHIKETMTLSYLTDNYLEEEWKHAVLQHITPTKVWKLLKNEMGKDSRNFSIFWMFSSMTPFHEGLKLKFLFNTISNSLPKDMDKPLVLAPQTPKVCSKKRITLFHFLPLLTIKTKNKKTRVKLFGFIPLLKIREK